MDNDSATEESEGPSPIFTAYRRGYDPDQVDRFVADQQRRLDESLARAGEAERRLAAAVGQLRELHRRVAMLENEERTAPPPGIDAIGERIQRILQEAWDGAYAMRQAAESDASEMREQARADAEQIVGAAKANADALGDELARRRDRFMARVDQERTKAVNQITFLSSQRKLALDELTKIRSTIDSTIEEFSDDPRPAGDAPVAAQAAPEPAPYVAEQPERRPAVRPVRPDGGEIANELRPLAFRESVARADHQAGIDTDELAKTLPVHRLPGSPAEHAPDPGELVRSHRASVSEPTVAPASATVHDFDEGRRRVRPALFDFEDSGDNSED